MLGWHPLYARGLLPPAVRAGLEPELPHDFSICWLNPGAERGALKDQLVQPREHRQWARAGADADGGEPADGWVASVLEVSERVLLGASQKMESGYF